MLQEITKRDFGSLDHMTDKHTNIEARAVIGGNNPGWVFVDDADDPQSALLWSQGSSGFYLLGSEDNEAFNSALLSFIEYELTPRMKEMAYERLELRGTHKKWNPIIKAMLAGKEPKTSNQRVYTYSQGTPPKAKPIPKGFVVVPVDRKLLSTPLKHSADIVDELEKHWHSVRVFLHDGFAYCVVHEDSIASICCTSFLANKAIGLCVETFDPYRRQGLAQAVVAECVKRAMQDKVVPYWDCRDNDNASVKTAESLGFKKQWEYTAYSYKLE